MTNSQIVVHCQGFGVSHFKTTHPHTQNTHTKNILLQRGNYYYKSYIAHHVVECNPRSKSSIMQFGGTYALIKRQCITNYTITRVTRKWNDSTPRKLLSVSLANKANVHSITASRFITTVLY